MHDAHLSQGSSGAIDAGHASSSNASRGAQSGATESQSAATSDDAPSGQVPLDAPPQELRDVLERAFAYRGDVTITLDDSSTIEGYVFDRRVAGTSLGDCSVRLFRADSDEKISVPFDRIRALAFTGKDCAAGKSFETWIRKYKEMKGKGLAASQ